MNKILAICAAGLLTFSALAQQDSSSMKKDMHMPFKYCASMKDGVTIITDSKGSVVKQTVLLQDGSTLNPNGTIIYKNGTRRMLKSGECVTR